MPAAATRREGLGLPAVFLIGGIGIIGLFPIALILTIIPITPIILIIPTSPIISIISIKCYDFKKNLLTLSLIWEFQLSRLN